MSPSPIDNLSTSASEAAQGSLTICWSTSELGNELWSSESAASPADMELWVSKELSVEDAEPPSWSFGFTPTFRKSVSGVDKKLQGRVLAAMSELLDAPLAVRGDTIKPLIGQFKGLWRYRIGDYRLVYQPRETTRLIVLLEFAPRGGTYES